MKPLVTEAYVVGSPDGECWLCVTPGSYVHTSRDFAKAARFGSAAEAQAARDRFVEQQRNAMHGPRDWRVFHASGRIRFSETLA
jgi:hypothetical protein